MMPGPKPARSHRFLGTAAVLGSLAFFVSMNLLTKHLSTIGSAEKVMYRMIVGIVAVLAVVRLGFVRWTFGNIPLLALRGTLGATAVLLYFYSIDHTTLARASFLLFTFPAWGAVFSWLFLKEPLGWRRFPSVAVIYCGAALLLIAGSGQGAGAATRAGDVAGLFCGLASGAATTTIRALHRHDSTWMIFFSFCFFAAAAGAGLTFAQGSYVAPARLEWLILLGIGLSSIGAHILFTTGFRYMDVTTVGALAMLQAPLSAVAAYLLLGEGISALTILGGLLVMAGGLYLAATSKARLMERAVPATITE